jgi:hypothetical protein
MATLFFKMNNQVSYQHRGTLSLASLGYHTGAYGAVKKIIKLFFHCILLLMVVVCIPMLITTINTSRGQLARYDGRVHLVRDLVGFDGSSKSHLILDRLPSDISPSYIYKAESKPANVSAVNVKLVSFKAE